MNVQHPTMNVEQGWRSTLQVVFKSNKDGFALKVKLTTENTEGRLKQRLPLWFLCGEKKE